MESEASRDLKMARFVIKGEMFDNVQLESSSSNFNLAEQWRGLQASFGEMHVSLENRVKELQSFEDEVELKRKNLELVEKSLSDKIAKMELRQDEVKMWLEVIDLEKRAFIEHRKAIQEKEKELVEGLERVKELELELDEWRKAVELEENRVNMIAEVLETREKQIDEQGKEVELRENRVDERCKELDSRENGVKQREQVLGVSEMRLNEDHKKLKLREQEMFDLYSLLESRENETNERFKCAESKENELKLKEEELKSKEKDVIVRLDRLRDCCNSLKEKECEINNCFAVLEEEKNVIHGRLASLDAREEEINKRSHDIELKEMQVNAQCKSVEMKEGVLSDEWELFGLKQKQVDELRQGIELKEKQMDEGLQDLKSKRKQIDEHFREMGVKEKEMSERYKETEIREKQLNRRKKAQDLREKQLGESRIALDSKLKEVDGCFLKEQQLNELSKELELKRKQLNEVCCVQEAKEKQQNELSRTLELEAKQINELSESLLSKQKQLNMLSASLQLKEGLFKKLLEGEQSKEKQLNELSQILKQKEKQLSELSQAQESKEKQQNELSQKLELKEKQINELSEALASKQKQLDELSHERKLGDKQMGRHSVCDNDKVFKLKEKDINVPCEVMVEKINQHHGMQDICVEQEKLSSDKLELKGKQTEDAALNSELKQTSKLENIPASKEGPKVDVKKNQVNDTAQKNEVAKKQLKRCDNNISSIFCAMDGKALQLYLNERVEKHGSMKEEVVKLLKFTTNPAKLVLEAMDGFFAPHLSKHAFEASIVRSSCLLLLEHLMDLNPVVSEALRKEATLVAKMLKETMRVEGENEVIVLAYLLLLVTYNFSTSFTKYDLRRLCGMIDKHRLAPRLRHRLGVFKRTDASSEFRLDVMQVASAEDSSSVKTSSDIHSLCRSMNEKGVRSYLIEHIKDYNALHDKFLDALRHASDPAKLVLDVCQITVLDSDKNRAHVNNTSWNFLLNLFMKLSPIISQDVRIEAKYVANFIQSRLKGICNPVDHYKFLQFVASYKLANSYNPDELLSHFNIFFCGTGAYRQEEIIQLCVALGLVEKIPGTIKSLIDREMLIKAVKYICVFKLEHTFPPVPLLEAHFENVKKRMRLFNDGTFREKIYAERAEAEVLNEILTCISHLRLDSKLSADPFIAHIKELEKEKERRMRKEHSRKRCASPSPIEYPLLQKNPRLQLGGFHQRQPDDLMYPDDRIYLPPGPPPDYDRPMFDGPNQCFNPRGGHGAVDYDRLVPRYHDGSCLPIRDG